MRKRKTVSQTFTPEVRDHLVLMDFLGLLTDDEIKMAKRHKLYKWDKFQKEQREVKKRGLTLNDVMLK